MGPINVAPRAYITGRPGPADRPPLPPGHPISWGSITCGTLLDRAAYPYPVFDLDVSEAGQ